MKTGKIKHNKNLTAVCLSGLMFTAITALSGCGEKQQALRSVELWLGGDVQLSENSEGVFTALTEELDSIPGIVNLEGPVVEQTKNTPKNKHGSLKLFNAPSALLELQKARVRVAGIANNHIMDYGAEGLESTVRFVKRAGILPAGSEAGPAVIQEGGLKIVVTAHDLTNGVPERLYHDLKNARAQGRVLIAMLHVTGKPVYLPGRELQRAVQIALNAGATVVAAHGTHTIGPVERRKRAVIAWGLGNLAFSCACTDEDEAILLRVTLSEKGVVSAAVIPVRAGLLGKPVSFPHDPGATFDLLRAIGSSALFPSGKSARF